VGHVGYADWEPRPERRYERSVASRGLWRGCAAMSPARSGRQLADIGHWREAPGAWPIADRRRPPATSFLGCTSVRKMGE
jgi:hypothetical protein